ANKSAKRKKQKHSFQSGKRFNVSRSNALWSGSIGATGRYIPGKFAAGRSRNYHYHHLNLDSHSGRNYSDDCKSPETAETVSQQKEPRRSRSTCSLSESFI